MSLEAAPEGDQQTLRSKWSRKAGAHCIGCGCRSRQHRVMWGAWAALAGLLTVLGVGGATLASAALFKSAKDGTTLAELGAWLGAVAAVAAALNARVAPQAAAHKKARDGFAKLVSRFDDFARITSSADVFSTVRSDWQTLTARRESVQDDSPEPAAWAKWWVGRKDKRCKENVPEREGRG